MITVHSRTERSFNTLGLGILHPKHCTVTEELNGLYELELEQPYDLQGVWKNLQMQNIIYAPTPDGLQPFRIYRRNPDMNSVTVYARHIFYDLLDNIILNCTFPVGTTGKQALEIIKNSLEISQGFTFYTDVTDDMPGVFTIKNMNGVEALLLPYQPQNVIEYENRSFISKYHSEIVRDKFKISMLKARGTNRGFEIRYGTNMLGLQIEEDISDIITRIYPFGRNGEEYSKKYVDSTRAGYYLYPKSTAIEYSDYAEDQEEFEDVDLEIFARLTFEFDKPDIPKINITVDFQTLSRLEGYQKYKPLEQIFLGDTIKIVNEYMGFEDEAKVISYEYDAISEKYNHIELGNFKSYLTNYISGGMFTPSNGAIIR